MSYDMIVFETDDELSYEAKQREKLIYNDKEFKRRQGIAAYMAIFAKFFFLDKLIFDFFKIPFPYMKLIINKKN